MIILHLGGGGLFIIIYLWHLLIICFVNLLVVLCLVYVTMEDAHDWLSEKKLGDTDELVLRQRKEMKGLQAKVKDLQCAKAEEKKRLQRIIVNREDTIDQLKYDLRVLDRTHKDLQLTIKS